MVSALVGMKFIKGGRNPAYGLDCWGLVMEVYRQYGVGLPDLRMNTLPNARWREVESPIPADAPLVVLISIHPKYIDHAGVYIGKEGILHTTAATGAVLSRISTMENRIRGYYRYVQDN